MSIKVMVAFGPQTFNLLEDEAKERGISVQELLRAVIIPEWFRARPDYPSKNAISGQNHGAAQKTRAGEAHEVLPSAVPRT